MITIIIDVLFEVRERNYQQKGIINKKKQRSHRARCAYSLSLSQNNPTGRFVRAKLGVTFKEFYSPIYSGSRQQTLFRVRNCEFSMARINSKLLSSKRATLDIYLYVYRYIKIYTYIYIENDTRKCKTLDERLLSKAAVFSRIIHRAKFSFLVSV